MKRFDYQVRMNLRAQELVSPVSSAGKGRKGIWLGLMLAGSGLGSVAQADIYTNTVVAGTPFSVSLDTGSAAWVAPYNYLVSADTGPVVGTSSSYSQPVVDTQVIPAEIGVEGAVNVYSVVTEYQYTTLGQSQSFQLSYGSSLASPISVPQNYVLSGNVQNLVGTSLLNSGNGYVSFDMGMTLQFDEPYVPNSGSAKLSFKLGTVAGEWTHTFERDFTLNPGSIDLFDGEAINLADFTYFEATYSVNGADGLTFGISNLDLDVWGGTSIYQETFIGSVPHETLLTSVPIPALLPPAVPEPETYAMLLAGLGLVGYTVSRRKRTL